MLRVLKSNVRTPLEKREKPCDTVLCLSKLGKKNEKHLSSSLVETGVSATAKLCHEPPPSLAQLCHRAALWP